MKEDVLILYSGGADSKLMLELALRCNLKPYCLLIYYEQFHKEELEVAVKDLKNIGIPYHIVNVENLQINSALTGNGVANQTGKVHSHYIPGRNTIFLSLALSVAEDKQIPTIWHGADLSDRINLFPDCYQEYFVKANELFKIAGQKPITISAPLLGMTKETILNLLEKLKIGKNQFFSGYGKFE